MSKELNHLVSLQDIDLKLDRLIEEKDSIPGKIESLKERLEQCRKEIEEVKKQLKDIQVRKKEKEIELDDSEQAIKKHQEELNKVKTNEAYQALLKEIGAAKKKKGMLEDEILVLMEEAEDLSSLQKEKVESLKKEEERVHAKEKDLQERSNLIKETITRVQAERDSIAGRITSATIQRYERIRKKWSGLAIARTKGDSCGGCQIKLPPQVINELLQDKDYVICDNCARILYLEKED